jgi:hypothetical protein
MTTCQKTGFLCMAKKADIKPVSATGFGLKSPYKPQSGSKPVKVIGGNYYGTGMRNPMGTIPGVSKDPIDIGSPPRKLG